MDVDLLQHVSIQVCDSPWKIDLEFTNSLFKKVFCLSDDTFPVYILSKGYTLSFVPSSNPIINKTGSFYSVTCLNLKSQSEKKRGSYMILIEND